MEATLRQRSDYGPGGFRESAESLGAGLVFALLVHAGMVFWLASWAVPVTAEPGGDARPEVAYVIQLQEEPEERFVETNPEKPSNPPDETANVAARDQQAAQEEVPKELDPENAPLNEEGEEEDSVKIVSGELTKPEAVLAEPEAMVEPTEAVTPDEAFSSVKDPSEPEITPPTEASPPPAAPDFIDEAAPDTEGITSFLDAPDLLDISEELVDPGESVDPQPMTPPEPSASPKPRPRPRLSPEVLNGPTVKNLRGVSNAGRIGIDARFTEFGDYAQRLYEAIGLQWNLLASQIAKGGGITPSRVVVDFTLNAKGEVVQARIAFSTAGRAATLICIDAVKSPAPFGVWTPEMIESLGDSQTGRITFIYR